MNTGGEAAEQIVRMSLNGVEVAAKITGVGAKNLAVLLYTLLSQQKKTKGKMRLAAMLRSGKELKVFSVNDSDLKTFAQEAKQYGILYCALRDRNGSPDGMTDIMVRAEDASKINRIVERFKLATVEAATVQADVKNSKADKTHVAQEKDIPEKSIKAKLQDEIADKPIQKEQGQPVNPTAAKTEKSPPSEPISKQPRKSVEGTTRSKERSSSERPSVREELKEIAASSNSKKTNMPQREDNNRSNKQSAKSDNQVHAGNTPNKAAKAKER